MCLKSYNVQCTYIMYLGSSRLTMHIGRPSEIVISESTALISHCVVEFFGEFRLCKGTWFMNREFVAL